MTTLDELIAEKGWVIADGATGTNYFKLGLETGYPPELWNVERQDDVAGLHTAFIKAGSQLVLTNSFGGTHHRLRLHEAQDRVAELNEAAARIARKAADAANGPVAVAGSIGPTGELFAPMGALDYADARAAFTEQALALAEGGADILWVETMSSLEEVKAAVDAAKATGLPVAGCMTFDTAARSMMGVTPAEFAEQTMAMAPTSSAPIAGSDQLNFCIRCVKCFPSSTGQSSQKGIAAFPPMSMAESIIMARRH